MNKLIDEKRLAIINFVIVSYFLLIYLFYIFKVDVVLIGVFVELFTIPFLLAQIVLLIISIKFLIAKKSKNRLTILSIVLLALCAVITISSFF